MAGWTTAQLTRRFDAAKQEVGCADLERAGLRLLIDRGISCPVCTNCTKYTAFYRCIRLLVLSQVHAID